MTNETENPAFTEIFIKLGDSNFAVERARLEHNCEWREITERTGRYVGRSIQVFT